MMLEELNQKMNLENIPISLKNALGEHNHLRDSILPSLMKNLSENQHNEYPQNIFEIGRVFSLGDEETGVEEKEKLAIVLCHEKTDFTEIRQVLENLLSSLGLKVQVKESEHLSYILGRVGEIFVKDKKIGFVGEIKPEVLLNWDLTIPVVSLELDLDIIYSLL